MIEFNGIDIIVQHRRDDDGVRRALAAAFEVPEKRVALIDDLSKYPAVGSADVVCVSSPLEGEFTGLLSIQAERLALPHDTPEQVVQQICELLDTRCLIPYEDANPYLMWLLSPGTAPAKIGIDPVAFDEGRYTIFRR